MLLHRKYALHDFNILAAAIHPVPVHRIEQAVGRKIASTEGAA